MSILKQIIEHYTVSHREKKDLALKEKCRSSNDFYVVETHIFNVIKKHISKEKELIFNSIIKHINEIERINNINVDEKEIKKINLREQGRLLENNYEVFMMDSCSTTEKLRFTNFGKKEEFEWFNLKAIFLTQEEIDIKVFIVGQDALFIQFSDESLYHFEDNYIDLPYTIKIISENDF